MSKIKNILEKLMLIVDIFSDGLEKLSHDELAEKFMNFEVSPTEQLAQARRVFNYAFIPATDESVKEFNDEVNKNIIRIYKENFSKEDLILLFRSSRLINHIRSKQKLADSEIFKTNQILLTKYLPKRSDGERSFVNDLLDKFGAKKDDEFNNSLINSGKKPDPSKIN
jgi:hypothetical protein